MRRPAAPGRPVVVKVGSSSLAPTGSGLDAAALRRVVDGVADAWSRGHPTVLVTSGAVAVGVAALGWPTRPDDPATLQVAAAVGQSRLMERYTAEFDRAGRVAGQVLLAGEVFADRSQYLHARRTLERMVGSDVVPVVNENDAVSLEELRFGDNDRLAALVAHLVGATMLVMLTDTSGLLSADPRLDREARLIDAVRHSDEVLDQVGAGGSGPLGSGGVATKVAAARIAAWSGIPTVVGPAADDDTIRAALAAEPVGTWVDPRPRPLPARKLWIAFGRRSEGWVRIDAGAVRALVEQGRSLLPVGVVEVNGDFEPGAAVDVVGPDGSLVAKGLARLAAVELGRVAGSRGAEAIHRDDLVILTG